MCGGSTIEMDENDQLMRERKNRYGRHKGIGYFLSEGWWDMCGSCWKKMFGCCCGEKEYRDRTIYIGLATGHQHKYTKNVVRNQKYSVITFIPKVLFEQFKFFLNLYFLVMATSQFIPAIRIGYLYTYWGPL
ncbi:hypothetical protein LOTGIDRAFT_175971, partial [Lottia gigantea]